MYHRVCTYAALIETIQLKQFTFPLAVFWSRSFLLPIQQIYNDSFFNYFCLLEIPGEGSLVDAAEAILAADEAKYFFHEPQDQ